jgi:protein-S-isoprenylcysteine O-methyltransferase Ste14
MFDVAWPGNGGDLPMPSDDGPRVRVIPPLVYLAGLLLGVGASRWLPTRVIPHGWALTIGLFPMLYGCALAAGALIRFRRAGTTVRPDRASRALVIDGPYRFTRNPMYLALALVYTGIALAAQSLWALLLLPAALLVIRYRVIAPEEAFLRRRFGDAYAEYQARVRRWV